MSEKKLRTAMFTKSYGSCGVPYLDSSPPVPRMQLPFPATPVSRTIPRVRVRTKSVRYGSFWSQTNWSTYYFHSSVTLVTALEVAHAHTYVQASGVANPNENCWIKCNKHTWVLDLRALKAYSLPASLQEKPGPFVFQRALTGTALL